MCVGQVLLEQYRSVIYHWEALELNFSIHKDGQWWRGGKKSATEKSEFATRISWWQMPGVICHWWQKFATSGK